MSDDAEPTFAGWCIVEQMGHRRFAGLGREVTVAGCRMLQLDIPAVEDKAAVTLFLGGSSIFCLTVVSERVARDVARGCRPQPVSEWDYPKQLAAPAAPAADEYPAGGPCQWSVDDDEDDADGRAA